jgi:hypothetical protein
MYPSSSSKPNRSNPATPSKELLKEIRRRRVAEKECESKGETILRQNALLTAQKFQIKSLRADIAELKENNGGSEGESKPDIKQAAPVEKSDKNKAALPHETESPSVKDASSEKAAPKANSKIAAIKNSSDKAKATTTPRRSKATVVQFSDDKAKATTTPRRSVRIDAKSHEKKNESSHSMVRRSMTPRK